MTTISTTTRHLREAIQNQNTAARSMAMLGAKRTITKASMEESLATVRDQVRQS